MSDGRNGTGGEATARREAIKQLGKDIGRTVGPKLEHAGETLKHNDVGFPGFGVVGIGLGMGVSSALHQTAKFVETAISTNEDWQEKLPANANNWAKGDDQSTVSLK